MILHLFLFVFSFLLMELVAWTNHKYLMHGSLWSWHLDHHRNDRKRSSPQETETKKFEKNDRFFLVYAIPGILLMAGGAFWAFPPALFVSGGIILYGLTYFIVHDLIIHERIKLPFKPQKHSAYLKALIRAHKAHHWPKDRNDFQNFGLLFFPRRYFGED